MSYEVAEFQSRRVAKPNAVHRALRLCLIAALLLATACKRDAQQPGRRAQAAKGPQSQATVVTIRTTVGNATTAHAIVIASNRARSTDEQDEWRLYDLRANTVTFVDDVEKTYRTEKLDALLAQRRVRLANALPGHIPQVRFAQTQEAKPLHGVNAQRAIVSANGYRRELWLGKHPAIPPRLFAMMQASAPPSTELAPMMRAADAALLEVEGFPLIDHSEVAGIVVDRSVASIEQKPVADALLAIPRDYKDVTPKPKPTAPPANRRRAS